MAIEPTRRLVTGVDANGRSCASAYGVTPSFVDYGRAASSEVWIDDGVWPPSSPDQVGDRQDLMPPMGGSVCRVFVMRPEGSASIDPEQASRFDTGSVMEDKSIEGPRWHTTPTLDYGFVLRGRIELHLDDGIHLLTAGDVIVQRATRHAWRNPGPEDCEIAFVLIDRRDHAQREQRASHTPAASRL
jgi:quercetin dioxygenase-like cupin family protein